MVPETYDPVRHGPRIVSPIGGPVALSAIDRPVVVHIHGLASEPSNLLGLARYLETVAEFRSLLFAYDSYLGFDFAADALVNLLAPYAERITDAGLVLVGHSMGGLVARSFLTRASRDIQLAIRATVLLAVPNGGVSAGADVVNALIRVEQRSGMPMPLPVILKGPATPPGTRSHPRRRSLLQLIGRDDEAAIEQLNSSSALGQRHRLLSVSGGRPWIPMGLSFSRVSNQIIQAALGETPNDGIVTEFSADITKHASFGEHYNNYSSYHSTNHFDITQNQEVWAYVSTWVSKRLTP